MTGARSDTERQHQAQPAHSGTVKRARFRPGLFAPTLPAGCLPKKDAALANLGSNAMKEDLRTAPSTALALGTFTVLSVLFAKLARRPHSTKGKLK